MAKTKSTTNHHHRTAKVPHDRPRRGAVGSVARHTDSGGEPRFQSQLLPRYTPLAVWAVTLSFRVYYVTDRANWWMVHPDEVFQSMEVAHIETYGYGFRSYDVSPPEVGFNVSLYREAEVKAGMSALRSPIMPYCYVMMTSLLALLGLHPRPYMLWRIFHVFISSLLPISVYRHTSVLTGTRDVSCVAAILTSCSVYLTVWGTRCLLHSFLSPLSFLAASLITDLFSSSSPHSSQSQTSTSGAVTSQTGGGVVTSQTGGGVVTSQTGRWSDDSRPATPTSAARAGTGHSSHVTTRGHHVGVTFTSGSRTGGEGSSVEPGGNHTREHDSNSNNNSKDNDKNNNNSNNNNSNISLPSTTTTTTPNTTTTPPTRPQQQLLFPSEARPVLTGFLVFLTLYIRPDSLLLYSCHVTTLLSLGRRPSLLRHTPGVLLGVVLAGGVGVSADAVMYGTGVFSPVNWFNFNVVNKMSTLFGSMAASMYVQELCTKDLGTCLFLLLSLSFTLFSSFFPPPVNNTSTTSTTTTTTTFTTISTTTTTTSPSPSHNTKAKDSNPRPPPPPPPQNQLACVSRRVLLSWLSLLAVYSLNRHKELRFLHDVIVLIYIYVAIVIVDVTHYVTRHVTHYVTSDATRHATRHATHHVRAESWGQAVGRVLVVIFVLSQYRGFPWGEEEVRGWSYQKTSSVPHTNACLDFLSTRRDVTGVVLDSDLFMTGASSLLRHDVILLAQVRDGFYQFDPHSRRNSSSSSSSSPSSWLTYLRRPTHYTHNRFAPDGSFQTSAHEFTRVSDYYSGRNPGGVASAIFLEPRYNYLVLRADRKFVDFGFVQVFVSGDRRVLRRHSDVETEYRLRETASRIPAPHNTTLLLHEADVLYHMAEFSRAARRFLDALSLDQRLVDAYWPLRNCYVMLGQHKAAESVSALCDKLFGHVACTRPRSITSVTS
ncbi:uncharacterized protein LOC101849821 [Aplysia californica]|uniref:Mannosyltransferase n=1 Tax=Aplysia californica TaxID=6500 RepID=A0ABM1AEY3_APLCA|nr:uncharacterized protein LOC101849821 [Aplysia californica]